MAGEIHPAGPSGLTCHVKLVNYNGKYWNGTEFETFNVSNLSTYEIAVTEDGSTGVYKADMPSAVPVGNYDAILYETSTGFQQGQQYIEYRGNVSSVGTEQVGDITYGDIKTQVLYNLGRGQDSDILAQLGMWSRMAMLDIMNWRDGWFMHAEATISIVDGTQAYDLPTDHKDNTKIFIEKDDDWVELQGPIDLVEVRRRFTPQSAGEPVAWSYFGASQFKVWPGDPDASFTLKLDYTRYMVPLSDDQDTNTITIFYPALLIAKMTELGFRYLQEREDARDWMEEADRLKKDLHANYVARVMGRDFHLGARTDVLGHMDQSRGTAAYIILK